MDISLGVAFLGGLASFFTPCVLPLVPISIGYMGGHSFSATKGEKTSFSSNLKLVINCLAFVIGFSLIFIVAGISISALGGLFVQFKWWVSRVAGLFVLLMGLHITGIIHLTWLDFNLKADVKTGSNKDVITSFLLGTSFALGWMPCISPILGYILALTLQDASLAKGGLYLLVYSAGMGVPFLLTAVAIEGFSVTLVKHSKIFGLVEKATGFLLVIVGLLLLIGLYDTLMQVFIHY
jgi:cytochrome c-type biogenesis protein